MNSAQAFQSILPSYARPNSEERSLLQRKHHKIQLSAGGEAFNKEVFTYPLTFTAQYIATIVILASWIRFKFPNAAWWLAVLLVLVVTGYQIKGLMDALRQRANRAMRVYFTVMLGAASLIGYGLGEWLWHDYSMPYFTYEDLQTYHNVNTKKDQGSRYADAGVVYFADGTNVLQGRGACLKNDVEYCIAPIVNCAPYGDCGPLETDTGSFDYFAVGTDCCGCPEGEFRCGDWNNPITHGGLRQIDDENVLYYKLALKEWQAQYGKTSKAPLFFHWELRPQMKANSLAHLGLYYSVMSAGAFFGFQLMVSFAADYFKVL